MILVSLSGFSSPPNKRTSISLFNFSLPSFSLLYFSYTKHSATMRRNKDGDSFIHDFPLIPSSTY